MLPTIVLALLCRPVLGVVGLLAMATSYREISVQGLIVSARRYLPADAQIVLIANHNLLPPNGTLMTRSRVDVIDAKELCDSSSECHQRGQATNTRLILEMAYLRSPAAAAITFAIIVDSKDVVFQADPLAAYPDLRRMEAVHIVAEHQSSWGQGILCGHDKPGMNFITKWPQQVCHAINVRSDANGLAAPMWNRLRSQCNQTISPPYCGKPSVNSGVILGRKSIVLQLLADMNAILVPSISGIRGIDQGALNVLLYLTSIAERDYKINAWDGYAPGPVLHRPCQADLGLVFRQGRYYRQRSGEPGALGLIPIIHQFNRCADEGTEVICAAIEPLVDKCTHGSDCNTHMSEVWTKWPAAGEAIDKCNRTHYMRYGA